MHEIMTVTKAKARLSGLVSRLIYGGDEIFITKKGKPVAVLLPIETYRSLAKKKEDQGLLAARGALADLDDEVDMICEMIYRQREKEKDRRVPL